MKKSRLLVALGLILVAAVAIIGLAAPQENQLEVELTVTVGNAFTLSLNTTTVSLNLGGYPQDPPPTESFTITATATSNWRRGYTITVEADQITFDDDATGSPIPVNDTQDEDKDYITRLDITTGGQDLTDSREVVSVNTKTPKTGTPHPISFLVAPDGTEYAGSYTTTLTFTMAPKT